MSKDDWVVVFEANGDLHAEIIRGLLEAQGIMTWVSQEGAGKVYQLGLGSLGKAEILVPEYDSQRAQEILDEYMAGAFEEDEEDGEGDEGEETDS